MSEHCIACEVKIAAAQPMPSGPRACRLCFHLPRMAPADRMAIEFALQGNLSAGKIASIMTSHGRPLSKAAVQRHQAHTPRQEPTTS